MFLHLDSSLRDWVFVPITLITVCVSLLMKYLTYAFNSSSKKIISSKTTEIQKFEYQNEMKQMNVDVKINNAIKRGNLLKEHFMYISENGFKQRKAFFCNEGQGFFNQEYTNEGMDIFNPSMMGDMLKKNLVNGLYYIIIILGGGYFFSGFILLKFPFGLTQKFRSMTQQGLNLPDVDVSYVSAISWCLILVFGVNSIIQHFDGGEEFSMLKQQMAINPMNAMQAMGPMKDYKKILTPEKESISILPQFYVLDDAVDDVIKKYNMFL